MSAATREGGANLPAWTVTLNQKLRRTRKCCIKFLELALCQDLPTRCNYRPEGLDGDAAGESDTRTAFTVQWTRFNFVGPAV